jgi:hypothetical protein
MAGEAYGIGMVGLALKILVESSTCFCFSLSLVGRLSRVEGWEPDGEELGPRDGKSLVPYSPLRVGETKPIPKRRRGENPLFLEKPRKGDENSEPKVLHPHTPAIGFSRPNEPG